MTMATTFPMEHQEQSNWCWDAVAVSVDHYFDPHSTLTQSSLATKVLGSNQNEPADLATALGAVQKLNTVEGPLSFAQIQHQLDQRLPVCVRIVWNEGGAHIVAITGYDNSGGVLKLYVSDPILKDSNVTVWDFDSFRLAY